jgi:hypothetical protein
MEKRSGIIGFTGTFRESIGGIPEGARVVFTGSVADCTPFIDHDRRSVLRQWNFVDG